MDQDTHDLPDRPPLPLSPSRADHLEDLDPRDPTLDLPPADNLDALADEEDRIGSVISHERAEDFRAQLPTEGDGVVIVDPVHEDDIYMDTTARGPFADQDSEPEDVTEDLGPDGTIVQEVGGEARY